MYSLLKAFPPRTRVRSISLVPPRKIRMNAMLPDILESRRPKESPEFDHSTLSNYKSYQVHHTRLELQILFDECIVKGRVIYNLSARGVDFHEIALDSSFLNIESIQLNNETIENFEVLPRIEPLGSKITIKPPTIPKEPFELGLTFTTTDRCTALQWLTKKQTSGMPYVFSQLEAIHARSLFPCFDTPSVKSPFSASITSPLPVVFSGISTGSKNNIYCFEQKVPIPAYLVGIASGDLASAAIGPRSTVYTEPFRLEEAKWEFSDDVEKFIQAAENIIFDYEWGTYDILINVNSYPYGGMESPNMTFATPTLIAHDKSNIDVIAHELAHSWSGNLVTNCSWNHFWLNEGWTVYLERRIVAAIHGESTRHFSALIGWNDLENSIHAMRNPNRFSTLVQNLNDGTDPDEAFSSVPYEKGFNLLFFLENLLGGTKEFDPFIKHYFKKFSYKSLDTFQFLDTLFEFFTDKRELLENVDWETWLFKPGMPPKPQFDTTLANTVYALAKKWLHNASEFNSVEEFESAFSSEDIKGFNSNQIVLFLEVLVQKEFLGHNAPGGYDWANYPLASSSLLSIYSEKIAQSQNAEIIFKTFKFEILCALNIYYEKLAAWLGTVGRMKFVRPGYRLLDSVDHKLAVDTFHKFKDSYHPICKMLVSQDLNMVEKM
ncbi:bifunctional aminopeptidase/epoxide hydrolase NDAI_0D01240 [Naumovozyma dairenensis CBS 421]|uniref:Leukotriene A(4) hydrolase n=1 Tax=Naumovozyma dairenensis (strain ATCC 10597 / BCRC 20456 / CBS 421 / NBRC 0211 / NRRL Y-12639) TaxID=1071378 RepID=G0W9H7_NAUDC|nr:hypothetical protein NDAI_0D01240 [Naumovozyma dairenensis CBS 421]CCD24438.1 hypothetical protein NDAI_0D01240 [Naumovozyma dairenensis CBS 421]